MDTHHNFILENQDFFDHQQHCRYNPQCCICYKSVYTFHGIYLCIHQMSQKFRHFIGYLSISDFLKQIPPRNTLIILFFFYTHQSLSTKTKHFGAGCSSPGSWLKINGSVLRDQKVWKKTKELNMCRIYICFEKSLIDNFLRTLKKKISYLVQVPGRST